MPFLNYSSIIESRLSYFGSGKCHIETLKFCFAKENNIPKNTDTNLGLNALAQPLSYLN